MGLLSLLVVFLILFASFKEVKVASPEQALHLRRISEYWKEGDYAAAKAQILSFLAQNEKSDLKDHLYAMLGDIYFCENLHRDALSAYKAISTPEFQKKTLLHKLHSLFALQEYLELVREVTKEFKEGKEIKDEAEVRFLLAESLWRHAIKLENETKKELFLHQAAIEFVHLEKTRYKVECLFPLAEIYKHLKNYRPAADLFLEASKKSPEKKEELLFQAGCMQEHFDAEKAADTFRAVYELKGKRAPAAAYNQVLLLFHNDKFHKLLSSYEEALKEIPQERWPLVHFYVGKSHYALGNKKEAVQFLEQFVNAKKQASPDCKSALLTLLNCASTLKDRSLLERTQANLLSLFPEDSASAFALLVHAELSEKLSDTTAALSDLSRIKQDFPGFEEKEKVLFDLIRLEYKGGQWEKCRQTFVEFVKEFPESSHLSTLARFAYNSCVHEVKDASQAKKEELLSTVQLILQQERKEEYRLLLAELLQACGKETEAYLELSRFVQDYPASPFLSRVHLLLAYSCKSDPFSFLSHAEKALALNPDTHKQGWIHLEMYNACLQLAQTRSEERENWMERAAESLFQAVASNTAQVKQENLLWLADFYYLKTRCDVACVASERASKLFERLLHVERSFAELALDNPSLEDEVLKFADLLIRQKRSKECAALLEALTELQKKDPKLPWKFQRRALLELARAYAEDKQPAKAILNYDLLIKSSSLAASLLADEALLEKARLEYSLLSQEERSEKNPKVFQILDSLKDLQIKKRLASEPIHLEAALDYVAIKTELTPRNLRSERAVALLKQLKEDFSSEEDLLAQDYHAQLDRLPAKAELFKSYMQYVDAEILHFESLIAEKGECDQLKQKAQTLLEEMQKKSSSLTPSLKKKVADTLQEVSKKSA